MRRRPLCLVCLLLLLGMCCADGVGFPLIRGNPLPREVQEFICQHPNARIWGEAKQYTETDFSASLYLKDAFVAIRSKKYPIENVKVFLKQKKEKILPGSFLVLEGRLEAVPEMRNPGEFDSRQYYACQHVYYQMRQAEVKKRSWSCSSYERALLRIKEHLAKVLDETAKEASPVFQAMVLGEKGALEEEVRLRYQMGGIIHILAISGLHISLLGMGLYKILKSLGLGIYLSGFLAFGLMLQYGVLTGGSVSTMRAVCMFCLFTGAKLLGRTYDRPTALAISALLILLESPAYLYTSGYLLSFGCVLGLVCLLPAAEGLLKVCSPLGKSAAASVSVFLSTLPITLYFFGEVSLAGIFLNLLVLPTVGAVLASGVGAALLGCLLKEAGMAAALPGRGLLKGYDLLCRLAGRFPLCTWVGGQPQLWQIFLYYAFLGILIFAWYKKSGRPLAGKEKRWRGRLLFAALTAAGVLALCPRRQDTLRITCLDVGQGDGIVLESMEGCYLVDGGSSDVKHVGERRILPFLKSRGISCLDGVLISHADTDHISGVEELFVLMDQNLTSLQIKRLYLPCLSQPTQKWRKLKALAKRAGAEVLELRQGDRIKDGELKFSFLSPEPGDAQGDINEDALVFCLQYRGFRGLFTGDIGEETEKKLMKKGLLKPVDFLKAGHHGSAYSTGEDFLLAVRPKEAVISCSSTNSYGHPSPETVRRLLDAGCQVDYTMRSGAVTVETEGRRIWVDRFLETKPDAKRPFPF